MGFELFGSKSIEELLYPSPDIFLSEHPSALRKLRNALRKIKFSFKGRFIVDLTIPNWVGGYFAEQIDTIAINPLLLLYGSEKDIAHVLFHEGLHAGVYTDGVNVDDEALVESMTKKRLGEIYGGSEVKSGYDSMVSDFNEYFGDMSFNDLSEMIEDGDEDTFDNLLEVMVVNPNVESEDLESLSFEEIKRRLGNMWSTLQTLFPRMMNSIARNNLGPHAGTNVDLHHFKLDSLLEKTAKKILSEKQELFQSIFKTVAVEDREHSREEIVDAMFKLGLGYLYDTEPEFINEMINKFIEKRNFETYCKNFKLNEILLTI